MLVSVNTEHHITPQLSTAQLSTAQHITAKHRAAQRSATQASASPWTLQEAVGVCCASALATSCLCIASETSNSTYAQAACTAHSTYNTVNPQDSHISVKDVCRQQLRLLSKLSDLLVDARHHFRVACQAVHCPGQHCCCCFMAGNQHCHQVIPQLLAADLQPQCHTAASKAEHDTGNQQLGVC